MKLIMCMILEMTLFISLVTIGIMAWAIFMKWEWRDEK